MMSHRVAVGLLWLSRRARSLSPLPGSRFSSNDSSRILTSSLTLYQDGIDIKELPTLIRRLDKSFIPIHKMPSVDDIRKVSEQDILFKMKLKECHTIKQVFKLLEMPHDQVTAYTAAFALQRLGQLHLGSHELQHIDSFISSAVMGDLCNTVTKEISCLSNEEVVNLVQCYQLSNSYTKEHIARINAEVECRVGDSLFSINDLCRLGENYSIYKKKNPDIVNKIVIHIGNRSDHIEATDITFVYKILGYQQTPSHRYILEILGKEMIKHWWKLNTHEAAAIMSVLVRSKYYCTPVLNSFGRLVYLNIHDIKERDLMALVTGYIHFNYSSSNLLNSLERYVSAKRDKIDCDLLALIMEYLRSRKLLSTKILDCAANHIEQNITKYDEDQLLSILRPFGHLNYIPERSRVMFSKIETELLKKCDNIPIENLIELLATFAFVERFPVNFIRTIFTPYVFAMVNKISDPEIKQQTGRYLVLLQSAIKLELRRYKVPFCFAQEEPTVWKQNRYFWMLREIGDILTLVIGHQNRLSNVSFQWSPFLIDFMICMDQSGQCLPADSVNPFRKIALLLLMPDHICANSSRLLGETAMKMRQIELQGYEIVPVLYDEISRCRTRQRRSELIRGKLSPYVDSSSMTVLVDCDSQPIWNW